MWCLLSFTRWRYRYVELDVDVAQIWICALLWNIAKQSRPISDGALTMDTKFAYMWYFHNGRFYISIRQNLVLVVFQKIESGTSLIVLAVVVVRSSGVTFGKVALVRVSSRSWSLCGRHLLAKRSCSCSWRWRWAKKNMTRNWDGRKVTRQSCRWL